MKGHPLLDVSPRGWGRVWLWTVLGTVFCIAITLFIDSFGYADLDEASLRRALLIDTLLPLVLAGPLLLFFTSKLRELAIAHHELTIVAATDSLTGVLNRRAFTELVDDYLAAITETGHQTQGALLVVDVDNFKAINDSYGHDLGDGALRLITDTLKATLRSNDLIGRIGGEEFAILLTGANPGDARMVAERIRSSVSEVHFAPRDKAYPLSISVGGAIFDHGMTFSELFAIADQQLYKSKQNGRNRVSVSPAGRPGNPLAA